MVKDIIVMYIKIETIIFLISSKRFVSRPKKSQLNLSLP